MLMVFAGFNHLLTHSGNSHPERNQDNRKIVHLELI